MAIRISSNITTKNAADTYATHLANLGRGGVHSKDSIAQMNSITTDRRFRFMLCVVANTGSGSPGLYWLNTPPNPTRAQLADNNNWQPVPLGISSEGVLSLLGFQNASSLTILDSTGNNGDTYIVDVGGSVNNSNIFGGQAVTLVVGDYLVYNNNQWNVVPTGASSVNWNTLSGKPTTFTPSPHTHTISDITDFPDLSDILTDQDVVNTITNQTNSVLLGNVGAIRDYVTTQIDNIVFPEVDLSNYYTKSETQALIDAIEGYTLYTSPSLAQLNIDVPNPNEGEFAFIQGEYAMYRYESAQWVKKYETANPSSDEALFLNNNVTNTATLKALGTAALSENNYILYRDSSDTFLKVYKLVSGTATESLPDVVLPDDYDGTTNAKYWQLAGSGGGESPNTFGNGLTKVEDEVSLGDESFSNILFRNLNGLPQFFIETGSGTYRRVYLKINGTSGGFEFSDTDFMGTDQTRFYSDFSLFRVDKSYQGHAFEVNPNGVDIELGSGGNFKANKDFSGDYTDLSFVQKIYINSLIQQTRSQSTTAVPSSKLLDDELNKFELLGSTGTVIAFDEARKYGYPTAETGNITFDFTNAIEGMTQVIRHNAGTEPTIPASAIVFGGEYVVSVNNYIYLTPVKVSSSPDVWEVHVTYNQNQNA